MRFFSQLNKPTFWSQFLLGMMAILALPAVSVSENTYAEPVADQQIIRLNELSSVKLTDIEQPFFLQQALQPLSQPLKQAVIFCEFFANFYRLSIAVSPPIRAGPRLS